MTTTFWCEHAWTGTGDGHGVRHGVEVETDGGRIVSITAGTEPSRRARVLPGVTIPGLANAHSHAFHRALRSRTQRGSGSFWTWRDEMYRAAERLDPDSYFELARATFAEMVLGGITAVGEFHYLHHQRGGEPYADPNAMGEALLGAASEAGLRITLLDTLYVHGGVADGRHHPPAPPQRRFVDPSAAAWAERVDALAGGPTHRIGAAVHSARAVDLESMRTLAAWADERGAVVHAHLSEQPAENEQVIAATGMSPTRVAAEAGLLGERFTAVHGTHLDDDDIRLLAGSTVCMCPTTERDLGDGIGPTEALRGAGVGLALGSDSHAVIDIFEEARALELDERLRSGRRGVHTAADLLAAATGAGHRSLGWDDAGRLEVGARADLVTVALDTIRTAGTPPDAVDAAVVFAASAADVRHVVIDGRVVVRDGRHVGIDVVAELDRSIRAVMGD